MNERSTTHGLISELYLHYFEKLKYYIFGSKNYLEITYSRSYLP